VLRLKRLLTTWVLLVGLCLTGTAGAQITEEPPAPFPDTDKFARGFYTDAEMGTLFFLGPARKPMGFGVAAGARVGYDFFRWAAFQLHALGSTHKTDFGAAPQSGELLQLYQLSAELKIAIPIRQISIFGTGGVGVGYLTTNLLETSRLQVDGQTQFSALGGLGVDYHTLTRHFSVGLSGTFLKITGFAGPGAVAATAYIRYTF
jgi:hypothetical protein